MEKNYYYVVNEKQKTVVEFYCTDAEIAAYARLLERPYYDHFPYAEFGYEDPYNFIADWCIYDSENGLIGIKVLSNNTVQVMEGI